MLGKMLIQGLLAAALIGSAAAVYAQTKDNGYLKPDAPPVRVEAGKQTPAAEQRATTTIPTDGRGYVLDRERDSRKKHDGHHDGRRHDDDDD